MISRSRKLDTTATLASPAKPTLRNQPVSTQELHVTDQDLDKVLTRMMCENGINVPWSLWTHSLIYGNSTLSPHKMLRKVQQS
jgi:hypothetical protein